MKKLYLIILLGISTTIFAQEKGIIYYGFVDALSNGNANGLDYNAYMTFSKDQSYYVTAKDSLENPAKKNEQKVYLKEGGGGEINNGMAGSPQGNQVVYNIKQKTIWSNIEYKKQVYVKEDATKFVWKIVSETKKTGSFVCKKATTTFRGRNYIAWYAPNIPVSFGPWKLNGLPGLILEAYDTNKKAYWYFKSVEYPTKNKENVNNIRKQKNEKISFLTIDDFKKFQIETREKIKDRMAIMKKQMPDVDFEASELSDMFIEIFE